MKRKIVIGLVLLVIGALGTGAYTTTAGTTDNKMDVVICLKDIKVGEHVVIRHNNCSGLNWPVTHPGFCSLKASGATIHLQLGRREDRSSRPSDDAGG